MVRTPALEGSVSRILGLCALGALCAAPWLAACGANANDASSVPPAAHTAAPPATTPPPPTAPPPASTPEPVASSAPIPTPPPDPCGGPVPGMACIPAGNFLRGSVEGNANEKPQATIYLDAYLMDVTEVTVEMHDACVASKKCKSVHTVYPDMSAPKQPKTGVRWYDAVDFCKAMGKHLPTEAEWEKAARGTDGRLYPWGNEPATCERAVIMDKTGRSCGVRQKSKEPDKGRTFEVGTRAPNQYGLYDMSGNAWEWVADFYSSSYAACGDACLGSNPKGPCGGVSPCPKHEDRAVRGGSWFWEAPLATATYRRHHVPSNNPYHHYGFRCAASLSEAATLRPATEAAAPAATATAAPAVTATTAPSVTATTAPAAPPH